MKFYLVGGSCRDMLMGIEPKDYDFVVVGASPQDMLDRGMTQVGKDFPVFLHPDFKWEIALARTERKTGAGYSNFDTDYNGVTLEEDLARRDLTINTIAIEVNWEASLIFHEPVTKGTWIDPFNGMQDIKDKMLRPTTKAFKEDPVRLLRAARFLARYEGFSCSGALTQYGHDMEYSGELDALVPERVWKETEKALHENHPEKYFKYLVNFDFPFTRIFTQMLETHENNAYHRESSVFEHTMMVLEHAAKHHHNPEVNFAALLHDIAKPICYAEQGNAHGHDEKGVELIKEWCAIWKVPNNYRDLAVITCEQHQKVHQVMGRGDNAWSRPKSIMKMFEQTAALSKPDRFKDMLKVCLADNMGRITDEDKTYYFNTLYLFNCLEAVLAVDTKSISSKMLAEGKSGLLIGEAIRVARIDAIRKVQKDFKEVMNEL